MTNRNGKIDIDLPIKGNLNDPDFRYGGLVFQALGNLVTKLVTSPFSAIAGLVGGKGEELSEVQFYSGTAAFQAGKRLSTENPRQGIGGTAGVARGYHGHRRSRH